MERVTLTGEELYKVVHYEETVKGFVYLEDESGPWIDDGKYSYRQCVLKNVDTGKFYMVYDHRSGSYFSDYYYDWRECPGSEVELREVVKKEKVIYEWEEVE